MINLLPVIMDGLELNEPMETNAELRDRTDERSEAS